MFDPPLRNQGSYYGASTGHNDDYQAGFQAHQAQHNYFSFDIASACVASSVTLQVTRFNAARATDDFPRVYSLFDVSTPAAELNDRQRGGSLEEIQAMGRIFDDLGTGTSYGQFGDIGEGDPSQVLSFPLDGDGVANFNAARGGFFSVGGVGPVAAPGYNLIFAGSGGNDGTQQLLVGCSLPATKEDCLGDGWESYGFAGRRECRHFVRRSERCNEREQAGLHPPNCPPAPPSKE
jgi:hypothetical protein